MHQSFITMAPTPGAGRAIVANVSCFTSALSQQCGGNARDLLYPNDPKFSDRQFWANSADQIRVFTVCYSICFHCLLFHLHLLAKIAIGFASLFEFYVDNSKVFWCPKI